MSTRLFISALLLTVAARAGAQNAAPVPVPTAPEIQPGTSSETDSPVALDELIARALQNNQQPQIAAANLEAARARAGSARAQLGPTLQVVPGIFGNSASRDEEIILSQPLDVFGQRRASRAVFEAQVRRAQAEQTLAQRSLVVSVRNAAADLFAAQEAESLGQTQVAIARQFRDAAARRGQLGDAPPVQAQRAQLELDRAAIDLDQARAQRLSRRAVLNQLIGQAPQTPLRVALPEAGVFGTLSPANGTPGTGVTTPNGTPGTGVPSVSPSANPPGSPPLPGFSPAPQTPIVGASSQVGSDLVASRAALLPGALLRPDVLSAQASLEAARAQVTAIARTRRPLIELQARRGGVFDRSSTSLRAVITVPLFDFGSIKREQKAAQFDAQGQELQVALLKSQIAAQVEGALVQLNQNRLTVARYRDSLVPQTLDLLRKTQIGYAAGASTFLEVLEAQRATRQIQTEYLQALVGVRTGEAALESAFGASVPAGFGTGVLNNPGAPATPPGVAAPGTLPPNAVTPGTTTGAGVIAPTNGTPLSNAPVGAGGTVTPR